MSFMLPFIVAYAFASATLWTTTSCFAFRPPPLHIREVLPQPRVREVLDNAAFIFEMPVDHFGDTSGIFGNRYWVNDTYYNAGGPVFLFDSGEQNAEPLLPYYLQEYHGLSAVMRLAKRYKGLAILWEHRFYGESLPFPVNENTTAEQWRFLTTDQALEDVVYFANAFIHNARTFHPSSTPWVWVGGSYPGVRGALLRQRNPETIFAAWASSAPVHAQVDMASYYAAAERSLTRNCSADWVAVTRHVDGVLRSGNASAAIEVKFALLKALLSGPGGNTTGAQNLTKSQAAATSDVNAASILMEALNFYQYYGFEASVLPFCNIVETRNFSSDPVEAGLAATLGVDAAFKAFLTGIAEIDYDSIPGVPDDPVTDRSWMWQYCSEYGFYQRGDPTNSLSIETSFLSLELFQAECNSTFPEGLPSSPAVEHVNKYGGWDMRPSNVLFTNGEFDPWRTMGLASIEANSPHRTPTASVPRCNEPAPGESFFGITYAGMVHASDMRVLLVPDANHTDFRTVGFYSPVSQEPFYTGLALFQLALDEWLPYFNQAEAQNAE